MPEFIRQVTIRVDVKLRPGAYEAVEDEAELRKDLEQQLELHENVLEVDFQELSVEDTEEDYDDEEEEDEDANGNL